MATWVRATAAGRWGSVDVLDIHGYKIAEKVLVVCAEENRWCIDGRPVDVQPMLVVSFTNEADAAYFVTQRRAGWLAVEPDMAVMFENESDAMFFVRNGLGDRMSDREVTRMIEMHKAQLEGRAPEPDEDEPVSPPVARKPGRKKAKAA